MKKSFISLLFFISFFAFSQEKASVKKSLTGVQIGFFGVDFYNEARLSDEFSLRSQFTLNPAIWGGDMYSKTGFALSPEISITPKYYYNLQKRINQSKNNNNSGNYLALKLGYIPNWFVISNSGVAVNQSIVLIPTWGLRRNFSKNINYEFKAGIGLGKILKLGYRVQVAPDIGFKIGYDF